MIKKNDYTDVRINTKYIPGSLHNKYELSQL